MYYSNGKVIFDMETYVLAEASKVAHTLFCKGLTNRFKPESEVNVISYKKIECKYFPKIAYIE